MRIEKKIIFRAKKCHFWPFWGILPLFYTFLAHKTTNRFFLKNRSMSHRNQPELQGSYRVFMKKQDKFPEKTGCNIANKQDFCPKNRAIEHNACLT